MLQRNYHSRLWKTGSRPNQTECLWQWCRFLPDFIPLLPDCKILKSFLLFFPFIACGVQVFQPRTQSVQAEAGPGGVVGGLKALEPVPRLEGKVAGVSQLQVVQQQWQERWQAQQLLRQQLMLLMATVFRKVCKYCTDPYAQALAVQKSKRICVLCVLCLLVNAFLGQMFLRTVDVTTNRLVLFLMFIHPYFQMSTLNSRITQF